MCRFQARCQSGSAGSRLLSCSPAAVIISLKRPACSSLHSSYQSETKRPGCTSMPPTGCELTPAANRFCSRTGFTFTASSCGYQDADKLDGKSCRPRRVPCAGNHRPVRVAEVLVEQRAQSSCRSIAIGRGCSRLLASSFTPRASGKASVPLAVSTHHLTLPAATCDNKYASRVLGDYT